jgi:hypothetical protein
MRKPQFSLRLMLRTFTLVAVVLATWAFIEQMARDKIRRDEIEAYRLHRAGLKAQEGGMSKKYYDRESADLDTVAARLGISE